MLAATERDELRGQVLNGRFRVGKAIGTGGTGVVFEALRLSTLEPVVIKVLRPAHCSDPDQIRRMWREAEVARRVFHQGIVPIIEQGTLYDSSPYLVMQRLYSESLASLQRRLGPLSGRQISVIVARLASILHSVHLQGYIHRDIKPDHVLLDRGAYGELRVHLLDFGVCAARDAPSDERQRERGRVYGTPSYASPEQASGNPDVDGRADLFGVGVVMFEALTGKLPFPGTDASEVLRRIILQDAPSPRWLSPRVDPAMDRLVAKLLNRTPERRFMSARLLMRALGPWLTTRMHVERALVAKLRVDSKSAQCTSQTVAA